MKKSFMRFMTSVTRRKKLKKTQKEYSSNFPLPGLTAHVG